LNVPQSIFLKQMPLLSWFDTLINLLKTPCCTQCFTTLANAEALFCSGCRQLLGQRDSQTLLKNEGMALYAAGDLKPTLKKILYGYKYYSAQNAMWLANFAIDYWRQLPGTGLHPENTLLLTIPAHANSTDDARLTDIARPFSRAFGYEFSNTALRWGRTCLPQHGLLTRRQRFQNVAGAFSVDTSALKQVQRVIILDDITTTGATLLAAAQAIRQASPERKLMIEGIALARITI
jgi:predicted amidophosphoribosyltransferase